mgnify:CR=1 FL=1
MIDKNAKTVKIGDIVKIENSPINNDNCLYVVVQDGTSDLYSDKESLTLYKVHEWSDAFTLSKTKYNICFFPLCNTSNRYNFTRQELDAATIEIIRESDSDKIRVLKANNEYEPVAHKGDIFNAEVIDSNGEIIEDVSYYARQFEKLCAFFSNLTLKPSQYIEVQKVNYYEWQRRKGIKYKLKWI